MELTSEEIVTRLLAEKEILNAKRSPKFMTNHNYNLGEFFENYVPEPSPYEGKYFFIK